VERASLVRLFGGPGRYHQGRGALDLLGKVSAPFGPAPLVIADAHVLGMLRNRIEGYTWIKGHHRNSELNVSSCRARGHGHASKGVVCILLAGSSSCRRHFE
jgi:glycerol dehydrogenase-like iron-containing ADH family enzyme